MQVQGGKFVRVDPTTLGKFDCTGGTFDISIDPVRSLQRMSYAAEDGSNLLVLVVTALAVVVVSTKAWAGAPVTKESLEDLLIFVLLLAASTRMSVTGSSLSTRPRASSTSV